MTNRLFTSWYSNFCLKACIRRALYSLAHTYSCRAGSFSPAFRSTHFIIESRALK